MGSLHADRLDDRKHDGITLDSLVNGARPTGPCSEINSSRFAKMAASKAKSTSGTHTATGEAPPLTNSDRDTQIIRRIAKELAVDIVYYVSNYKKLEASSKHAKTLRRTVDELLDRHSILFTGMVKKLDVSSSNGKRTFKNVADEMFSDKSYNWGRVVSVYAFGGRLAKYCAERHMYEYIDKIAEFLGDYVAENIAEWIHKQGGWVSNLLF